MTMNHICFSLLSAVPVKKQNGSQTQMKVSAVLFVKQDWKARCGWVAVGLSDAWRPELDLGMERLGLQSSHPQGPSETTDSRPLNTERSASRTASRDQALNAALGVP